jgi:four helix bundle protein
MMQDDQNNPALEKSYAFALQVVGAARNLQEVQREFVLSRQLLRSGTAIGAKVEEAVGAQPGGDFMVCMGVAYKEARETHYWLRLLHDSRYLETDLFNPLLDDCEELLRIIGSICKKRNQ